MVKTLERETVHGPIQIEIMDQSGVNPWINGRYDLIEVELSDHSMSRTYRDHHIRIFTNAY